MVHWFTFLTSSVWDERHSVTDVNSLSWVNRLPSYSPFVLKHPLEILAYRGELAGVQWVLSHASFSDPTGSARGRALICSVHHRHLDVARYLLQHGAPPQVDSMRADAKAEKYLGPLEEPVYEVEKNALLAAVHKHDTPLIRLLISAGADVSVLVWDCKQPRRISRLLDVVAMHTMHYSERQLEVVEMLTGAGAVLWTGTTPVVVRQAIQRGLKVLSRTRAALAKELADLCQDVQLAEDTAHIVSRFLLDDEGDLLPKMIRGEDHDTRQYHNQRRPEENPRMDRYRADIMSHIRAHVH